MPGFPGNGTRHTITYFEPPAIAKAIARSIATHFGRGADWRSMGWRPGDMGGPQASFRGYSAPLQRFDGALITPSRGGIRPGLNQLLPGTTGLPGEPSLSYVSPVDGRDLLDGMPWDA